MFGTVRHWWDSGRGKLTARLFLFELVVVVAGVLTAQGLANWVQDRAAVGSMEQARKRSEREIALSVEVARIWQAAVPCLGARMEQIQREASRGPIMSGLAARPKMRTPTLGTMSDEAALIYRQRYGDVRADQVSDIVDANDLMIAHIATLQRVWYRLALADERFGAVSVADRQSAREAAADALASLRTIGILASSVVDGARELGIGSLTAFPGMGPARSCAAIWRSGRIDPPLTSR